jgi:hypothetical protein
MLPVTFLPFRLPNKHTFLLGRKPAVTKKTKQNLITFISLLSEALKSQ